ncbi:TonB-dependent receptor [Hymenobacter oligotrophus]|uniref:TonB-dependent receptor n=1 Tax=Hymenobacter oligotrophus TaxID=2319843 RepID=A0A3B7R5J9_9BACT|nr:TonB-dependent receptor [Hymenobacter oligotrophus]AYA36661.1 TonB-dependent receptor [Hymenobacter oligotrophus]
MSSVFTSSSQQLPRLLLVILLLLPLSVWAQTTGSVTGTLLDGSNGQPVPFANVVLLRAQDSTLVTGAQTADNGAFKIEGVPFGNYSLRVTQLGYRPARRPITLSAEQASLALGQLRLRSTTQQLKGVTVTGERAIVQDNLDKKVINVSKDLSTVGGTAVDVLQNVPSVNVDQNGSVSLRGSQNVTIYIDGKPTGAAGGGRAVNLDQIPASQIESVEIVTNPSARYDAEGSGGILNIVLKKEQRNGLNGSVTLNAGTRDKYNGSVALNLRQGKFNFFGNYDARYDNRFTRRNLDQVSTLRGRVERDSAIVLTQRGRGDRTGMSHSGRFGFDYTLSPQQTITLSVQPRLNTSDAIETLNANRRYAPTGADRGSFIRRNDSEGRNRSTDFTLDYRRTWAGQKRRELMAMAVFTPIRSENITDSRLDSVQARRLPAQPQLQQQRSDNRLDQGSAQIDYVHPLGEKGRLDLGLKSVMRRTDADFQFLLGLSDALPLTFDASRSNRFKYEEYIQAAYLTYQNVRGKLNYQVGLRTEQTNARGRQLNTAPAPGGQPFPAEFRRSYLGLFPSVTLAYDVSPSQRVQASYSRRLNRPDVNSLNPFIDYSDPLNYQQGNPYLLPEYINASELGYQWFKGRTSVTGTAFYRYSTGVVQRLRELDAETGITTTRPQNISNSRSYGVEASLAQPLAKWWRVSLNGSAFRNVIAASTGTELDNKNFAYTGRLNSVFTPIKSLDLQVSAFYRSRTVTTQGSFGQIFSTELGAKYSVLKDRGAITLRVSDVFDTQQFNIQFRGPNFRSDNEFKRETRVGFIGFTYRFGQAPGEGGPQRGRGRGRGEQQQQPQQDDNLGGGDFGG